MKEVAGVLMERAPHIVYCMHTVLLPLDSGEHRYDPERSHLSW